MTKLDGSTSLVPTVERSIGASWQNDDHIFNDVYNRISGNINLYTYYYCLPCQASPILAVVHIIVLITGAILLLKQTIHIIKKKMLIIPLGSPIYLPSSFCIQYLIFLLFDFAHPWPLRLGRCRPFVPVRRTVFLGS